MSTTLQDTNSSSKNDNLETFCLFWLDASANKTAENIESQPRLRTIINYLKTFTDPMECEKRIQSMCEDDRVVLIVSGSLGRQIVPRIHSLRQLSAVYVYCMDIQGHKQWTTSFNKVESVTADLDKLIENIRSDQQVRLGYDEPLSFLVSDRSTGAIDGKFLHLQLLIDILIQMKSSTTAMDELLAYALPLYNGNSKEQLLLKNFKNNYQPEKAVWWYSRDSCIYRMLNKAFRVQDLDVLFDFRFFMRDLQQQLQSHQCSSSVRVYRGQYMSTNELKSMKTSAGELISMNSFLSTSVNRDIARTFLKHKDNLERVLFEIDADPQHVTKKPFAEIHDLSYFKKEAEVLFMVGSIFLINDVHQDDDGVWLIHLKLCSDNNHELNALYEHMRKDFCGGDVNLLSLGNVLQSMGKFDHAEKIYHRYLNELPPNDPNVANCYHGLGIVLRDKGQYEPCFTWLEKAFDMYKAQGNRLLMADLLCSIGLAYYNTEYYRQAIESYEQALAIYQQEFGEVHRKLATCFDGIGAVYGKQKMYSVSLANKKKALFIWQKELPGDHADLGQSYTCIGTTYSALEQYDVAMHHFNQSIAIYEKSIPPDHPRFAMTFKNIGIVHENTGDVKQALWYYKKAAAIYHYLLSSDNADVVDIEERIKRVS